MLWLVLAIVAAWTAIAIVAGLVMGAAVRKARQMQPSDPYAGLLVPEQRRPVAG